VRYCTQAASLVAILAAGNLFYAGTGPTGLVLSMTGRPGINFVNSAVAVTLYIGLGIWIVPRHGAVGMAWVDAAVTAVINVVRVVEAKLLVGVHPFGRSLLKPIVASIVGVVTMVVLLTVLPSGTATAVIALACGGLLYLAVLKKMGLDPRRAFLLPVLVAIRGSTSAPSGLIKVAGGRPCLERF
jgi:O-antigen/teichoic acid export membrane protein